MVEQKSGWCIFLSCSVSGDMGVEAQAQDKRSLAEVIDFFT